MQGSILSDTEILAELGKDVIIDPFIPENLQPASVDVRLGSFIYRANRKCKYPYFNPENGEHVLDYWNVSPDPNKHYGALLPLEIKTAEQAKLYGCEIGDLIIILEPGELILGHTIELIGSRNNIRPDINARSTMGRCGITICKCAGAGDPSYFNIWTLEIENHGTTPRILRVGSRVGHVKFTRTGPVSNPYTSKGNYQTSLDVEELKRIWNPLTMIPSAGVKLIKKMQDGFVERPMLNVMLLHTPVGRNQIADVQSNQDDTLRAYFLVNTNLSMQQGKRCGQVGHAVSAMLRFLYEEEKCDSTHFKNYRKWLNTGETKIVLPATEEELKQLISMQSNELKVFPVYDAGKTQIPADSLTVVALLPTIKSHLPQWIQTKKLLK